MANLSMLVLTLFLAQGRTTAFAYSAGVRSDDTMDGTSLLQITMTPNASAGSKNECVDGKGRGGQCCCYKGKSRCGNYRCMCLPHEILEKGQEGEHCPKMHLSRSTMTWAPPTSCVDKLFSASVVARGAAELHTDMMEDQCVANSRKSFDDRITFGVDLVNMLLEPLFDEYEKDFDNSHTNPNPGFSKGLDEAFFVRAWKKSSRDMGSDYEIEFPFVRWSQEEDLFKAFDTDNDEHVKRCEFMIGVTKKVMEHYGRDLGRLNGIVNRIDLEFF